MFSGDGKIKLKFSELKNSSTKTRIIFIVGIIVIILVFCFDMFSNDNKTTDTSSYGVDINTYKTQMEKELTSLLKNMSGVGKVKVMITLESNQEIIYETEAQIDKSNSDNSSDYSKKENCVIVDNGSENNGLVKKINEPKIRGVLVICEGGGNVTVKAKVTEAVEKLFSISSARVCVTN